MHIHIRIHERTQLQIDTCIAFHMHFKNNVTWAVCEINGIVIKYTQTHAHRNWHVFVSSKYHVHLKVHFTFMLLLSL